MRESEERLARVTYSAMDAIVTFDGGLKIELFNEAAEKIFRCKADHAIGASLSRFLTESFRSPWSPRCVRQPAAIRHILMCSYLAD